MERGERERKTEAWASSLSHTLGRIATKVLYYYQEVTEEHTVSFRVNTHAHTHTRTHRHTCTHTYNEAEKIKHIAPYFIKPTQQSHWKTLDFVIE